MGEVGFVSDEEGECDEGDEEDESGMEVVTSVGGVGVEAAATVGCMEAKFGGYFWGLFLLGGLGVEHEGQFRVLCAFDISHLGIPSLALRGWFPWIRSDLEALVLASILPLLGGF